MNKETTSCNYIMLVERLVKETFENKFTGMPLFQFIYVINYR